MRQSIQAGPGLGRFITTLLSVLGIHVLAAVIFFTLTGLLGGECSRDDTLAAGLGLAVLADVILVGLYILWRRRRVSMLGLAVSLVPAVALVLIGVAQVNAASSGCPV